MATQSGSAQPDESVWGKSRGLERPYPLAWHLLDAAAVALFLWDRYLSENQKLSIAQGLGLEEDLEQAQAVVGLCAGLHDVGKISLFQFCDAAGKAQLNQCLLADRGKLGAERFGHDVAGMEALPLLLDALGLGNDERYEKAVERIAQIVGGHHGRYHRLDPQRVRNLHHQALLGGPAWATQRQAHAATVHELLGRPKLPEAFTARAAVLVTGVVILADWLVSQKHYLKERQRKPTGSLREHFDAARADAERLAAEAGLLPLELERKDFSQAYDIKGDPNPLQASIAEELPGAVAAGAGTGILLVTAAPGDGKTETALEAERILSAAAGTRGFAFLLPTMATSDQMYGRVSGVVARQGGQQAGLTLTHSMAWLSRVYGERELQDGPEVLECDADLPALDSARRSAPGRGVRPPTRWLRGSKRPLLAQFSVGTVDQALMAVLPLRHNMLRLLALSGKTFIMDEAHAYDPYMQVLLGRLLNWLGAYGCPVVLLSATLPASVSDRLIKQYLLGAGHKRREVNKLSFQAPYPGWLYVDAGSGQCTQMSPQRQAEQAEIRHLSLAVQHEPVLHLDPDRDGLSSQERERARLVVLERELEPVFGEEGGCALVVCNTVGQAQETYQWLKQRFASAGTNEREIQLLHARFPGDVRERRAEEVVAGLGRTGPRPQRRVVVATQVVEQSLDLDADVVISDLAPLALLLQRAGRCWRHEQWWAEQGRPGGRQRPAWAAATGPRLVVLDPLLDGGAVPKQWGEVYAPYPLQETSELLAKRGDRPIEVPGEVQELVEAVHGDRPDRFDWMTPQKSASWTAYAGEKLAQESLGRFLVVPGACSVAGLEDLHQLEGSEDEWEAATRLGADSVRLLCAFQHGERTTLDLDGGLELQQPGEDGRFAIEDVRVVMRRTIPVNASWFKGDEARDLLKPPQEWEKHPLLGELVVLRQPVRDGAAVAVQVNGFSLRLDDELGLVRERG